MNDTLKVAGRIGAELGAAKAENERLRGLLHGAHDTIRNLAEDLDEGEFQATIDQLAEIELALAQQQAEPECRCTLRERMVGDGCSVCNPELAAELAADIEDDEPAPAQDDRDLVAETLEWYAGMGKSGARARTALAAYQATRPAQTEQQPIAWMLEDAVGGSCLEFQQSDLFDSQRRYGGCMVPLYAAPIAQTAPQPEQSGLVGQVCGGDGTHNTVNVAAVGPVPWGELRIGTPVKLIPAPAQGAVDE